MSITCIRSVVILWCIQYSLGLYQDCNIRGQPGSCQHIEDCPSAINSIVHNENPQICYLRGSDLEVCCLNFYRRDQHERGYPRLNRRPHRRRFGRPRPYPFNGNELPTTYFSFQTSTSVPDYREIETSNQYPVASNSPETKPTNRKLEEVTSISLKKCLKYYPVPRFPSFVAGGEKSLPKQYPHMVSFGITNALIGFGDNVNDKQWLCGGSLISKKFILTAGHCLFSNEHGNAKWVHLGDLDLSTDSDDASPQDFNIKRRIPFPDYRPPQKYHDIALLELDKEVKFSPYVSPACLQTTKEINDTSMIATGWGKTDFAADASSFLMNVDLNEMGIDDCQKYYGVDQNYLPNGVVNELQICAGGVKGKDTCGGDSGGPLQIKNHFRSFVIKVSTVVGITSFGKACGLTPAPGIYTRVSYYRRWIESIVWENDQD